MCTCVGGGGGISFEQRHPGRILECPGSSGDWKDKVRPSAESKTVVHDFLWASMSCQLDKIVYAF